MIELIYLFGVCVHVCVYVPSFLDVLLSFAHKESLCNYLFNPIHEWIMQLSILESFPVSSWDDWLINWLLLTSVTCVHIRVAQCIRPTSLLDRYPLKDERPSPRRMIEIKQHLRRNSRCEMLRGRIIFYVHIRHLCVRIALSMSLSAIISRCSRTLVYNIGVSSFLSPLFSPASSLSSFSLVLRDISGMRPEQDRDSLRCCWFVRFFLHNLARVCIINIASHTSLLPRV